MMTSAERVRKYRQRLKLGRVIVAAEFDDAQLVAVLTANNGRWLDPAMADDPAAVRTDEQGSTRPGYAAFAARLLQ